MAFIVSLYRLGKGNFVFRKWQRIESSTFPLLLFTVSGGKGCGGREREGAQGERKGEREERETGRSRVNRGDGRETKEGRIEKRGREGNGTENGNSASD